MFIFDWFKYHFYFKFCNVSKIEDCVILRLKHVTNVHGDRINMLGCRSIWKDKHERIYYCDELFEEGRCPEFDDLIEMLKFKKKI